MACCLAGSCKTSCARSTSCARDGGCAGCPAGYRVQDDFYRVAARSPLGAVVITRPQPYTVKGATPISRLGAHAVARGVAQHGPAGTYGVPVVEQRGGRTVVNPYFYDFSTAMGIGTTKLR